MTKRKLLALPPTPEYIRWTTQCLLMEHGFGMFMWGKPLTSKKGEDKEVAEGDAGYYWNMRMDCDRQKEVKHRWLTTYVEAGEVLLSVVKPYGGYIRGPLLPSDRLGGVSGMVLAFWLSWPRLWYPN